MFHDLDATLAALLDAELAMENVTVSFATPDDQFPPSSVNLPAIALLPLRRAREPRAAQQPVGAGAASPTAWSRADGRRCGSTART